MPERLPSLHFLEGEHHRRIRDEATRLLEEVGVAYELAEAVDLLAGHGARVGDDGRVRIDPDMVEGALGTVPGHFTLHDRSGAVACRPGEGTASFVPGSAALDVLDPESGEIRRATREDGRRFACLTQHLEAFPLQSTCVVPEDVSTEAADAHRLLLALRHCTKPVVTGTTSPAAFPVMREMLEVVRGGAEALRERPLAVFDCCPTSPLGWSELTTGALLGCARAGIPATLVAVPMTGATGPVTLRAAVTQHAAENLAGLVLHQLAAPGAPLIWGGCPATFDMRQGTTPLGAPESMMLNAACSEVGRSLGLPTHGYLGLSDAKQADYQAGLESGAGALVAALSGLDVVSGPGLLAFVGVQSLEKLILDHEACRLAQRIRRGLERREDEGAEAVIAAGVEAGQFLKLKHTRTWFRRELHLPGPTIDRGSVESWRLEGAPDARSRARAELGRALASEPTAPLEEGLARQLEELAVRAL